MEEKLNIGILGAGWFGRGAHLANLVRMPDVNVVAVSSRSQNSLDQAREIAGDNLRVSNDWKHVIQNDAIDAVVIALTNDQHHAACMAALEAGKHVLCEKPLAMTVRDCDEIIAAIQSCPKVLAVGHEMRYQRLYRHMKQLTDRGDIGDVQMAWCREFRGPMRPGWRSSQSLTGGTILEKNCHHFDLFNWLLESPPVQVAAVGGRNVLLDREVLDNAFVLVEHAGGRRAVLELCLFAPFGGDIEIGLVGDAGRIDTFNQTQKLIHHRFDMPERTEMDVADAPEEAGFVDAAGHVNRGVYFELRAFIDCCRSGNTPMVDATAARMSVAVCIAAQESIRRNQMVTLEEILDEY